MEQTICARSTTNAKLTKNRIAFVLPSFEIGGSQRVLLNLFRQIDRTLFDPHLVVFDAHGGLAEMVEGLASVHVLNRPRLRNAVIPLWRALKRLKPDTIFSTLGYTN